MIPHAGDSQTFLIYRCTLGGNWTLVRRRFQLVKYESCVSKSYISKTYMYKQTVQPYILFQSFKIITINIIQNRALYRLKSLNPFQNQPHRKPSDISNHIYMICFTWLDHYILICNFD